MTGYQESITDQVLQWTDLDLYLSLVGNYGINRDDYEIHYSNFVKELLFLKKRVEQATGATK